MDNGFSGTIKMNKTGDILYYYIKFFSAYMRIYAMNHLTFYHNNEQ